LCPGDSLSKRRRPSQNAYCIKSNNLKSNHRPPGQNRKMENRHPPQRSKNAPRKCAASPPLAGISKNNLRPVLCDFWGLPKLTLWEIVDSGAKLKAFFSCPMYFRPLGRFLEIPKRGGHAALGCGVPGGRGAERRRIASHRRSGVTRGKPQNGKPASIPTFKKRPPGMRCVAPPLRGQEARKDPAPPSPSASMKRPLYGIKVLMPPFPHAAGETFFPA
jgi:hypothetical protein